MKKDNIQLALNKYHRRFDKFMAKLSDDMNKDKSFKDIKGSVFCGTLVQMKNEINAFLREHKK